MADLDIIKKAEEAKALFDNYSKVNTEIKSAINSNNELLKDLENKKIKLTSEVNILQEKISELKSIEESLGNKTSNMVIAIEKEYADKSALLKEKESSIDIKINEYKKDLEFLLLRKDELDILNNNLIFEQSRIDSFKKDLDSKAEAIKQQENIITEYKKQISESKDSIAKELESINTLKYQLSKEKEQIDSDNKYIKEQNDSIVKKQEEINNLFISAEAKQKEANELKDKAEKLLKEANNRIEEASNLELTVKAQEAKLNSIIRKKNLENEIKSA